MRQKLRDYVRGQLFHINIQTIDRRLSGLNKVVISAFFFFCYFYIMSKTIEITFCAKNVFWIRLQSFFLKDIDLVEVVERWIRISHVSVWVHQSTKTDGDIFMQMIKWSNAVYREINLKEQRSIIGKRVLRYIDRSER